MRTCTIIKRVLRGIRFSIALKEESYAFLVWSVRVESRHNHDLPWQIPHEAGRAEDWLTQPVEAFNCKLKCCFWSPTCICNTHTHNCLKHLMFFTPRWPTSCNVSVFHVVGYWKQQEHPHPSELLNYWRFNFFLLKNAATPCSKQGTARHVPFVHNFLKRFFSSRICYHSSFF